MDREVVTVILILLVIGFLWLTTQTSIFSGIGKGGPKLEPEFKVEETNKPAQEGQRFNIFKRGFFSLRSGGNSVLTKGEEIFKRGVMISNQRQNSNETAVNPEDSKYKNKISLRVSGAREASSLNEQIEISLSSSDIDNIPITGWKIKNSRNEELSIKQAAYIVYSASSNQQNDIILKKGQKAFLVTGRSPIGINFLTNICTGYFNQFHKFNPSLRQECPHPADEPEFPRSQMSDNCLDYIEGLPKCRMPFPSSLSLDIPCVNYVNSNINYDTCVKLHKFDNNFYGNEWRIYFERDQKFLKKEREKITLYDAEGKEVTTVEY